MALTLLASSVIACGGGVGADAACEGVNRTYPCECSDGQPGAAVCDGAFLGPCECTSVGSGGAPPGSDGAPISGGGGSPGTGSGGTPGGALCGNNVVDDNEVCDGTDLSGETCASATLNAAPMGTLACSSACTFDLSGCTNGGGTGGSAGVGGNGGLGGSGVGGFGGLAP